MSVTKGGEVETDAIDQSTAAAPPAPSRTLGQQFLRALGWTLISFGAVVLLYVVYLLWFTGLETQRAQTEMLESWEVAVGDLDAALPGETQGADDGDTESVAPGDAYAALWFERDGERIVHDDTLYVVQGVTLADLRRGPGHFPDTPAPGQDGNVAIAGHRTTYGQPFYNLNELEIGDEIHVVDRDLREWVYEVAETRIVRPTDVWVVEDPDPRGTGRPTLTLTTCNPRFSAAQRLIVWGHLVEDGADGDADSEATA